MPSSPVTTKPPAKRVRKAPRPAEPTWLSPKEAAAHLGVAVDRIYDFCASGLRHTKLGYSTIRIRREALDAWMEQLATTPPAGSNA